MNNNTNKIKSLLETLATELARCVELDDIETIDFALETFEIIAHGLDRELTERWKNVGHA